MADMLNRTRQMNNILTTLSGALTIAGLSPLAVFESLPIIAIIDANLPS